MSIIYRPEAHACSPPRGRDIFRHSRGTIYRCACGRHWVSDGVGRWYAPFPFGRAWRRIRRIEKAAPRG